MGLSVNGVRAGYSEKAILEHITFDANQGQMMALLGPNGSGKTTLLKTLSKALSPHAGSVLLDGAPLESLGARDVAKKMAVIPQSFETSFAFTVEEIVMMGRSPHIEKRETEEDFAIVRRAMEATNVWHLRDTLITNISGGERQRAIIARALAQEPKVLLLDEPTSNLDITHQIEVLSTIHDLARSRNLTVIAAFHDLNLAAKYFDTLILLHGGTIRAMGAPREVLRADLIKEVYGVDVLVQRHPLSDTAFVVPLTDLRRCNGTASYKVHVIGGGGSATTLLHMLSRSDFNISLGAINLLDSDHETAQALGITCMAVESPFSPVSDEAYRETLALIDAADAVVLSDFNIGSGNIANLRAAQYALDRGKPVLCYEPEEPAGRDFTGGEASAMLEAMKTRGARTFLSLSELVHACGLMREEQKKKSD